MPIKSLEDLRKALEGHGSLDEVLEFVVGAVESEKSRGISEKTKVNLEARNLRENLNGLRTALTKVGYEENSDIEEFMESLSEKLGSGPTTTPSDNSAVSKELAKLRRDFDKTQKELADERKSSGELKTKSARRIMKSKLSESLRDRVYGSDLLADALINDGHVSLEDDESVVFIDGEDRIAYDDGLKKVLESRPDILKNQQTPGARTSATQSRNSEVKYTRSQLEKLSREDIAGDRENVYASWEAVKSQEKAAG